MDQVQFQKVIDEQVAEIGSVLGAKAVEYARGDRLSNFKRAAALKKTTPERALEGMMTKHVIAIYDYIDDLEAGKVMPLPVWHEKIGDTINYLVLLRALIEERASV
jgi:hypothetical protein